MQNRAPGDRQSLANARMCNGDASDPASLIPRHGDYRHLVDRAAVIHSITGLDNQSSRDSLTLMGKSKNSPKAADWTRLLADPVLAKQLGKLLQICRDTPPEKREKALFEAIREIKSAADKVSTTEEPAIPLPASTAQDITAAAPNAPPFEPDIFTPSWGQDRRTYPRLKCFVAVELKVDGAEAPFWGNVANISLGGCLVEAPGLVEAGKKIEIGLWVSSGNLWVKGVVLTGTVASKAPGTGLRVKFSDMEAVPRETLKQFLKYVESTTKTYANQHGYLAQLRG